jgi:hypothetical protein
VLRKVSPNIVVVRINMGGKLIANSSHLTCQGSAIPSRMDFEANQNTMFDGIPNKTAVKNGLVLQYCHKNCEFIANHEIE